MESEFFSKTKSKPSWNLKKSVPHISTNNPHPTLSLEDVISNKNLSSWVLISYTFYILQFARPGLVHRQPGPAWPVNTFLKFQAVPTWSAGHPAHADVWWQLTWNDVGMQMRSSFSDFTRWAAINSTALPNNSCPIAGCCHLANLTAWSQYPSILNVLWWHLQTFPAMLLKPLQTQPTTSNILPAVDQVTKTGCNQHCNDKTVAWKLTLLWLTNNQTLLRTERTKTELITFTITPLAL